MRSAETVHAFRYGCARVPLNCILTMMCNHAIVILLLAVAEGKATLRSDLSAVYGVSGKSDTMTHIGIILLFLFDIAITLPENLNAKNLESGQRPVHRRCLIGVLHSCSFPHRFFTVNNN